MSFDSYLFEVAESGICGDLWKVEQMPMYEFLDVLEYIRYKNKINHE